MYNTSYNLYLGLQRKRSTLLKTSVPSQNLLITSHISQKIKNKNTRTYKSRHPEVLLEMPVPTSEEQIPNVRVVEI